MGRLALLMLTCVLVVLESTEPLDNRCFLGKNMTWPKDECNSVIIEDFFCRKNKDCPFHVRINASLPENVEVYLARVKLDNDCDCSCHCNCNRSQEDVQGFKVKSSGNSISIHRDFTSFKMDSICYQYYNITYNISSCCILLPAWDHDFDEKRHDSNNAVEPDRKEPALKEYNKNWYWGICGILGVLLVVALCHSRRRDSFIPHLDVELSSSPSTGTPPSKAGKVNHVVIIYANQCNPTTRKLIGKLIKGFESTLKDCTVSDYTKIGSLLERGIEWLYTGNSFDKVIVLLSPEVSSLQLCNADTIDQDFHSKFVYHFFTNYLLQQPRSTDKIIFIWFEQYPWLDLNFCSPSIVYALPTKLRDLLQLFDFEGDDSTIKEFESALRKEDNRA